MTRDRDTLRRLAVALPDIPRWLETRSVLLSADAEVHGLRQDAGVHFVVREIVSGSLSVVGRPDAVAIREAVDASRGSTEPLQCLDEDADYVAPRLRGWQREAAVLHLLASSASLPRFLVGGLGGMIATPYGLLRSSASGRLTGSQCSGDQSEAAGHSGGFETRPYRTVISAWVSRNVTS